MPTTSKPKPAFDTRAHTGGVRTDAREQRMPLQPGQVLVTDAERKVLRALGWEEGDPLPEGPELAKAIRDEKARLEAETSEELNRLQASKRAPLCVPDEVVITDLPPERQAALRGILQGAKAAAAAAADSTAPLEPSVARALEELSTGRVPDVGADKPFTSKRTPAVSPQPTAAAATPSPTAAATPSPAAASVVGTTVPPAECPHCGHGLADPPTEPSEDDKYHFAQTVLFGAPFTRRYELLGGRLKVSFRTLSTTSADLCLRQCGLDTAAGELKTLNEFVPRLISYRMAAALASVWVDDVEYDVAGPADQMLAEARQKVDLTPLPALLRAVRSMKPLDQEPVWRLLQVQYQRFARLAAVLEARADDPNFWQAAAG